MAEKLAEKSGVSLVLAVQAADIFRVAQAVNLPVFAQHVDTITYGTHTGHQLPEAAREAGAAGTLFNHAERPVPAAIWKHSLDRIHQSGLAVLACAPAVEEAVTLAQVGADMVSVEPPSLISSGISVSRAQPELVTQAVEKVRGAADIPVLCGAGIRTAEDVRMALKLGAQGVLLASGYCLAPVPQQWLEDLLKGF